MIRILIAEDSEVMALVLRSMFDAEPDMEVVGHARTGHEAVELSQTLKPDLVTMDVLMPKMDGVEATTVIMSTAPIPIVVISSQASDNEKSIVFNALDAGALAIMKKPVDVGSGDFDSVSRTFVNTVRAMAEIKVVRHRRRAKSSRIDSLITLPPVVPPKYEVVAIGCSTGGPQALCTVLAAIPPEFPVPIVVVQHITRGFISSMIQWLKNHLQLTAKLAENGEQLRPGTIYFAPDDRHLQLDRVSGILVAKLNFTASKYGFRPSVSVLMESVARVSGERAVGAVLTGMGRDGGDGLLALRQAGGHTFIQDEQSAVVYGMPGEALTLGAAERIVELNKMAMHLIEAVTNKRPRRQGDEH